MEVGNGRNIVSTGSVGKIERLVIELRQQLEAVREAVILGGRSKH